MFSKKSPGWTVEGYGYVRIFTKLKFQQLHNPPPFSISFLLKPLSQLPGVVTRSGSRHTTSGFLVNKNKAGFKQTKRSSPKWHFEGLKGYIYKTCPIRSPACRFFDTTKSFSEFCEGAWHESFQKSPR